MFAGEAILRHQCFILVKGGYDNTHRVMGMVRARTRARVSERARIRSILE